MAPPPHFGPAVIGKTGYTGWCLGGHRYTDGTFTTLKNDGPFGQMEMDMGLEFWNLPPFLLDFPVTPRNT